MILKGVFISTFGAGGGGVCRKRRVWLILFVTEDIVVSYTSKVEIPVSRYLQVILRGVFVFGS